MLANLGDKLKVGLDGCSYTKNRVRGAWYECVAPYATLVAHGKAPLLLADPYDRAVLKHALQTVAARDGLTVHAATLDGKPLELREHATELEEARRRVVALTEAFGDGRAEAQFAVNDLDKSGALDAKEIGACLRALGVPMTDADLRCVMARYDLDGTGVMEAEEWVEFTGQLIKEAGRNDRFVACGASSMVPYEVPHSGAATLELKQSLTEQKAATATSMSAIERLLHVVRTADEEDRDRLFKLTVGGLRLDLEQANYVVAELSRSMYGGDFVQAVAVALPVVSGPTIARALIELNCPEINHKRRLSALLHNAFFVLLGLTTGHHKLDLSHE